MHIPNNKIDNAEDAQDDQNNEDNLDDHLRIKMIDDISGFCRNLATLRQCQQSIGER